MTSTVPESLVVPHSYIPTADLSHAEYSTLRNRLTAEGCIGGSMAAAVLDLDPYSSPLLAWLKLCGQWDLQPETERMWIGRMVEPAIRAMVAERLEATVVPWPIIARHQERSWQIASPDGLVFLSYDEDTAFEEAILLEMKNVGRYMAHEWEDNSIPDSAHLQVLHNLSVLPQCSRACVAALIANERLEIRWVERDEALIADIMERERAFHDLVETRTPPPVQARDVDILAALYPPGQTIALDEPLNLPPHAYELCLQYKEGMAMRDRGEATRKDAAAKLQAMLQQAEVGTVDDFVVSWKPQSESTYTVTRQATRRMTVRQRKTPRSPAHG